MGLREVKVDVNGRRGVSTENKRQWRRQRRPRTTMPAIKQRKGSAAFAEISWVVGRGGYVSPEAGKSDIWGWGRSDETVLHEYLPRGFLAPAIAVTADRMQSPCQISPATSYQQQRLTRRDSDRRCTTHLGHGQLDRLSGEQKVKLCGLHRCQWECRVVAIE